MRLGPGRGSASSAGPGQSGCSRFPLRDFRPLTRPTGPTGSYQRPGRTRPRTARWQAPRWGGVGAAQSRRPGGPPAAARGRGGKRGKRGIRGRENRGKPGPRDNAFPPCRSGRSLLAHARRRALPLAAARAARSSLASELGRESPRSIKQ